MYYIANCALISKLGTVGYEDGSRNVHRININSAENYR